MARDFATNSGGREPPGPQPDMEAAMKLPRRLVTKLSLATVLSASAGLGWAAAEARAGLIEPVVTSSQTGEGTFDFGFEPAPYVDAIAYFGDTAQVQVAYDIEVQGPPGETAEIDVFSRLAFRTSATTPNSVYDVEAIVNTGFLGHFTEIRGASQAPPGSILSQPSRETFV